MLEDLKPQLGELKEKLDHMAEALEIPVKEEKIAELEYKMGEPTFWDDAEAAQNINQELADYNAIHGADSITLGENSLENGVMHMSFIFSSAEDYNNYMPDDLYLGTVQGAYDKGYDFNRSLYKASASENSIGKKDLLERGSDRIAVLTGTSSIKLPDKIDYYSQGMTMDDKYTVTPDANGIYFVLY